MLKALLDKKSVTDFLWIVIGNTFSIGSLLVVLKIFTRELPQVEYGTYYLSLSIAIFANQIVFGPIGNGIARYLMIANDQDQTGPFMRTAFRLCKQVIIFLTLLFLLAVVGMVYYTGTTYLGILVFNYLFALFSGLTSIIYALQNINRERKVAALTQVAEGTMKMALTYFLLSFYAKNATSAAIANALPAIGIFLVQVYYLYKSDSKILPDARAAVDVKWAKNILKYSYPFAIWGVFSWAQISSDRWFLESYADTHSVASYAVLFQLGYYPITVLIGFVVQAITPILFQKAGDASSLEKRQASTSLNLRIAGASLLLTLGAFVFVYFFQDFFIQLLASPQYDGVAKYLPLIILSGGIFATSQILSLDFLSRLQINQLMFIKIVTSALGVAASLLLIKSWGFEGAMFSNLSFSVFYLLFISIIIFYRSRVHA